MAFEFLRRSPSENTLVDEDIEGRRLEYVHQIRPEEVGILRAYFAGNRDTIQFEFFETHARTRDRKGSRVRTPVLEEVVVHIDRGGTETFRTPKKGIFSYTDTDGNTYDSNVHDPVEKAVVNRARARSNELGQLYKQLRQYAEQAATRRVSG